MVWSCRWEQLVPMSWPSPWRPETSNEKTLDHSHLPYPFFGAAQDTGIFPLTIIALTPLERDGRIAMPRPHPEERTHSPGAMATSPGQEASRRPCPAAELS